LSHKKNEAAFFQYYYCAYRQLTVETIGEAYYKSKPATSTTANTT